MDEAQHAKCFDSLVKSFFTNPPLEDTEAPPRSPSRMGFLDTQPLSPRPRAKRVPVPSLDISEATLSIRADTDEDTNSDSSDEWSAESDSGDSGSVVFTPSSSPVSRVNVSSTPPSAYSPIPSVDPALEKPADPSSCRFSRPALPHHGLSRSALQHQKWMWNARYDEWMQWQMEMDHAAAEASVYGGIVDMPAASPPPFLRARSASPAPEAKVKTEMNQNIFPRTGDLSSLRDPQAATLDRTFCNYPLCTIQKLLFLFNVDVGSAGRVGKEWGTLGDRESSPGIDADSSCDMDKTLVNNAVPRKSSSPERSEQDWRARWEVLAELVGPMERREDPTISSSTTVTTSIGLPVVARSLEDVVEEPPARPTHIRAAV
ncbi:hypothetical protein BV25DRAFT_1837021 [Artomyces pyxidatus]|uniref:Uncharacterized protein n=1 Tax=Artomyces pyxidatus TaxID=48021 RepID=A0ACB8T6X5_9AGAM|nr:hypothetical protein BV25DRAFT_1837021 [Artomyces pyxidatus]